MNETLTLLGCDGQLRICSEGGQVHLRHLIDAQTLAFLQSYADTLRQRATNKPLEYKDVYVDLRNLGGRIPDLKTCFW